MYTFMEDLQFRLKERNETGKQRKFSMSNEIWRNFHFNFLQAKQ